jgi:hypothetical protein
MFGAPCALVGTPDPVPLDAAEVPYHPETTVLLKIRLKMFKQ